MNYHLKISAVLIANTVIYCTLINVKTCVQSHLTTHPSLCRSEPHGAAVWLPGEDQPNAQLDLQHRESHSEDVASPGGELWAEEGWDWRDDGRHAAVWPHQHGRLQHPRTAHQTGANRAIGCCGILVCRHSGVGTSNASSWASRDILTCLPGACTATSEVWFQ